MLIFELLEVDNIYMAMQQSRYDIIGDHYKAASLIRQHVNSELQRIGASTSDQDDQIQSSKAPSVDAKESRITISTANQN